MLFRLATTVLLLLASSVEAKNLRNLNNDQDLFSLPQEDPEDQDKADVCHFPPGKPENFKTLTIENTSVQDHIGHGDLLGTCEVWCEEICATDNDLCTSNVDKTSLDKCTCLPEPQPVPFTEDEQCCTPYGNILPATECCPIGESDCCGLTIEECITQFAAPNNAYDFQQAILGPLPAEQAFPTYVLDPEIFDEAPGTYMATTQDGTTFEVTVLQILATGAELTAFFTNGDTNTDWEAAVASFTPVTAQDADLKALNEAIIADWKTPLSQEEVDKLAEQRSIVTIFLADVVDVQGATVQFVGLANRYTNAAAIEVVQLSYLADPVLAGVSTIPARRNLLAPRAVCQAAFDAALAAASQACEEGEFTQDSICESALITACVTNVETYQTAYEVAVAGYELALATAKAFELKQKVELITAVALACARLINPWAAAGCFAVALASIEYAYYQKAKAIEELTESLKQAALDNRDALIQGAKNVLVAAADACWDCECAENDTEECCPSCQEGQICCRGTCISDTLCCDGCPPGQKCCDSVCIAQDQCCDTDGSDPCCGSEDPCCGSTDPCCGQPDCGGNSGDPHMTTFDGLRYDCQGRGHFILTQSGEMQVQARFRKQGRVSLTTGMAVSEGPTSSVVEVSIPVVAGVGPVVYVNGTEVTTSPPNIEDGNVIVKSNSDNGPFRVTYKDTALTVTCSYRVSGFFGRYFNCRVALPATYRTQGTQGLLGSADDNSLNDWMQPDGTIVPIQFSYTGLRGQPALEYCVVNWCIRNETNTLFTFFDSTFDSLSDCDEVTTEIIDITNPPAELVALCGNDEACLIEGVEGGLEAAQAQLVEQAELAAAITTGQFRISPATIAVNTIFNLAITVDLSASGIPAGTIDEFNLYRVNDQGQPGSAPILQLPATGNNIYSNALAVSSSTAGEVFSYQAVAVVGGVENTATTFTRLNAVSSYSEGSGLGGADDTPCGGPCEDDGDLCTIETCDDITNRCLSEPVACGNGEACDSFTGRCQDLQNIVPCVAVIDEWNSRNYANEWASFRAQFPQRPFCLLVPNGSIQTLPTGYNLDTVNNPDCVNGVCVDRTLALTVNRDNGNVGAASNWFEACNLGSLSPSSVSFVGLFVDTSGSMTLNTVRASYDQFLLDLEGAGLGYQQVFNNAERWIDPFLTTLAPPTQ